MLTTVATFSYAIAASAFFVFFILLITRWRSRMHGIALAGASLFSAIWAVTVAFLASKGIVYGILSDCLEIVRSAGWTIFLVMVLGPQQPTRKFFSFTYKPFILAIVCCYILLIVATLFSYLQIEIFQSTIGLLNSIVGRVALAVFGMLLVEQLFRNTPDKERWGIKFACFGIGSIFAFDFYLYSDAILFRKINPDIWMARGIVNALTVPMIALSAARHPQWSTGISVSRRILFHSTVLFGSAIYLLSIAAGGYYLRFFGGDWGTLMQVAFMFAAALLLIAVLFSGSFRSQLKVFISKHFYHYNYDYREEWLRFTRILSKEGPGLEERTILAVAELVESPGGVLFVRRESLQFECTAHLNMPRPQALELLGSTFCQLLENKQWVIDLEEYKITPKKYDDVEIPKWLKPLQSAWLVVPLELHGHLFGFMILAKPRSKIRLNWEIIDLLKIAGSQAASYLAQQESANALIVARQFESFNRMSTFMVHDLKNLASQLSLIISNAEKHKDSPEFQKDMLETVHHSVQKMKLLLQKLTRSSSVETPSPLIIDKLLEKTVSAKSAFAPQPQLKVHNSGLIVNANWDRLERVIGHIIQNAIEATARDGLVIISISKYGDTALIELKDNGQGMSDTFIRERLFKPFDSTKTAGMGIGAFESREYIHELGGQLEVESRESLGTTFRVILPLYHFDEDAILLST